MARPRYTNAEVTAGLFLTFSLGLFVVFLFYFGKTARLVQEREQLTVFFNSVITLRPDAPVRFNGVEVGRVKSIRHLMLDKDNLDRLPLLRHRDLENLPLTDQELLLLRKLPAPPLDAAPEMRQPLEKAFREKVFGCLRGRSMVELVLDVSSESEKGASKRFRVDDQVRVTSTLLGDTAVEINSGTGPNIGAEYHKVLLGVSGDFFTNLAKSVEQVRVILAQVSDVAGDKERESVRNALRRFDAITLKIENVVSLAEKRLPGTWDKLDALAATAQTDFDAVTKSVADLQPKAVETLETVRKAVTDLHKRLADLSAEAQQTVAELRGQLKPLLDDSRELVSKSKDEVPLLLKSAKDLADRLRRSADKLDAVLETSDRLLHESYPDLRRLVLAFRMGAENFEEATDLIRRKPWLIYNVPPDADNASTPALETARKLDQATRRFQELQTELTALRRSLDGVPNPVQVQRFDFLLQELAILNDVLAFAGEPARKRELAPFERKRRETLLDNPERQALPHGP